MSQWPGKYVIGLTGNIAVGKSVVRQMLQHLGAYTIDADGLSHQAMSPGAPAYKPVVETFGQMILNPDRSINRTALGRIVFANPDAMKRLESLTHPIIRQAINTLIKRSKRPVVAIEAIKLLEGDLKDAVDAVWVVDASPKSQYIRLITKRKMSEEDAKQRIRAQTRQQNKVAAADVVIKNDANVEETWKQVQAAFNKLKQPAVPIQAQAQRPAAPAAEGNIDISGLTVKRGMPSNAEVIANFITKATGKDIGRMDVIISFGQKSYLVAEAEDGTTVGLAGWQVENLITRVDEIYITEGATKPPVIHALVSTIEEASMELQSEVSFIFLPNDASEEWLSPFTKTGYEITTVKEIKVPAWREAVQELAKEGLQILTKKLRANRVLKPI